MVVEGSSGAIPGARNQLSVEGSPYGDPDQIAIMRSIRADRELRGPTGIPRATLAWITVCAQPKSRIPDFPRHFHPRATHSSAQRIRTYAHSLRKTGLTHLRHREYKRLVSWIGSSACGPCTVGPMALRGCRWYAISVPEWAPPVLNAVGKFASIGTSDALRIVHHHGPLAHRRGWDAEPGSTGPCPMLGGCLCDLCDA